METFYNIICNGEKLPAFSLDGEQDNWVHFCVFRSALCWF